MAVLSWTTEYQGEAPSHLKLAVQDMNTACRKVEGEKPYVNMASIIQGSGSGKSRMVDELAQDVFTLLFNL